MIQRKQKKTIKTVFLSQSSITSSAETPALKSEFKDEKHLSICSAKEREVLRQKGPEMPLGRRLTTERWADRGSIPSCRPRMACEAQQQTCCRPQARHCG